MKAFSFSNPELEAVDDMLASKRWYLLGVLLAAPMVLVIYCLRPVMLIRFGVLYQAERIGVLAPKVGYLFLIRNNLNVLYRTIDIISVPRPVANLQLVIMLKRYVRVAPAACIWLFCERACIFWTRSQVHLVPTAEPTKLYLPIRESSEKLAFTVAEKQSGTLLLEALGIPAGSAWVCIHNRDSKYLDATVSATRSVSGGSWAYHNYRDFSVQTMVLTTEELASRGYYVLRMGAVVEEPLVSTDPRVIDYANTSLRGDFADIFLLANCAAFLGSDSGILGVPLIFGKPTLLVNLPLGYLHVITKLSSDPFISKHLSDRKTGNLLSLREVYERGLGNVGESRKYDEAGVVLVCNSPEEIRDLAVEMDERIKGSWEPSSEDERLQTRFWEIFRQYCPPDLIGGVQARIGSAFLRQNRYLLD